MDNPVELINTILSHDYFYGAFFCVMICCGLGGPLNSDTLILLTAGFSREANLNVLLVAFLAIFGMSLGDSIIYYLGHKFGHRVLNLPPFKWVISPERFFQASKLIQKRGAYVLVYSRLLPGTRTVTILTSATLKMPYSRYLIVNTTAMTVLVVSLVIIGRVFFPSLETIKEYFPYFLAGALSLLTLVIIVKIIGAKGFFRRQGF